MGLLWPTRLPSFWGQLALNQKKMYEHTSKDYYALHIEKVRLRLQQVCQLHNNTSPPSLDDLPLGYETGCAAGKSSKFMVEQSRVVQIQGWFL